VARSWRLWRQRQEGDQQNGQYSVSHEHLLIIANRISYIVFARLLASVERLGALTPISWARWQLSVLAW
jgi:hypothetical protein